MSSKKEKQLYATLHLRTDRDVLTYPAQWHSERLLSGEGCSCNALPTGCLMSRNYLQAMIGKQATTDKL